MQVVLLVNAIKKSCAAFLSLSLLGQTVEHLRSNILANVRMKLMESTFNGNTFFTPTHKKFYELDIRALFKL